MVTEMLEHMRFREVMIEVEKSTHWHLQHFRKFFEHDLAVSLQASFESRQVANVTIYLRRELVEREPPLLTQLPDFCTDFHPVIIVS